MSENNTHSNNLRSPKRQNCHGCPALQEKGYIPGIGQAAADIVFVGDYPPAYIETHDYAPFSSKDGQFLISVVNGIRRSNPDLSDVKTFYTYSVQCLVEKPKIEVIEHCSQFVKQEVASRPVKIVVALGANAMKSLGIKGTVKENRGIIQNININGGHYKLMATYAPGALLRKENAGLMGMFKADLKKALEVCAHKEKVLPLTLDQLTKDYVQPKTVEEVKAVCREILDHFKKENVVKLLSVDTETNTLEMYDPTSKCIAISFSWDKRKACTILLNHKNVPYDPEEIIPYVKEVLESDIPKCYHNYKFDYQVIELRLGWKVNNVKFCTLLGEHLLDENKKGYYGLKEIVGLYVPEYKNYEDDIKELLSKNPYTEEFLLLKKKNQDLFKTLKMLPSVATIKEWAKNQPNKIAYTETPEYQKIEETKAKRKVVLAELDRVKKNYMEAQEKLDNITFEDLPIEKMIHYAAIDADVTRQIALLQIDAIAKEDPDMFNVMKAISIPASRTLGSMSYDGFRIDLEYLEEIEKSLDIEIAKIKDEITLILNGKNINLNANADIINVLLVDRGLKLTTKTKKAKGELDFSTSKDVLKELYETSKDEFLKKILEYRECYKARHTFLKGIRQLSSIDGKIHTNFNLNGTATGRLSSSGPNLQNLPKMLAGHNIKKLFIPDDPETEEVCNSDYSAAEVRVLTAYTHDSALIDAINSGKDIHSYITSEIYKLPYDDLKNRESLFAKIDPAKYEHYDFLRTSTKRATFLTIYGGGAEALQSQLKATRPGITLEECDYTMNLLLEGFPKIKQYMADIRQLINKRGYVKSKFGRKRRFPIAAYDWSHKNAAYREGINMPIQSTSSDIVLSQLIEMAENAHELGIKLKITVHDSLVFTYPKVNRHLIKDFLQKWGVDRVQERFTYMPVPFAMEAGVGRSYGECKETIL